MMSGFPDAIKGVWETLKRRNAAQEYD